MKIYNTVTRNKEPLTTLEEGRVKIYACGPTVYNYIHIGNARPICVFDVLRRYLEYRGYAVTFVQNFTDIDDKIIAKANEEGVTSDEIAQRYIDEYKTDAAGLGVRDANHHPTATEVIPEIIEIVSGLIAKSAAYEIEGTVYFRSKAFAGYGKLSGQPLEELEAGARVDLSEAKEDALDFVLWKAAKPGEPSWSSPWGEGRPGWHIECTAMVTKYLGEQIDIHCGGQDLTFPHHENEVAQSESYTGKQYVRYWMHNGYINVDNRKMSKSVGNFFTVRDVSEKFGYEPIKFMMLQAHYRSPINYSYEVLEQCKAALDRLYTSRENIDDAMQNPVDDDGSEAEFLAKVAARRDQFVAAMDDDLNTADGLAALFEAARDANTYFSQPRTVVAVQAAADLFDEICAVLGILYNRGAKGSLEDEIQQLIDRRQQARKEKDFATADKIRDELAAQGIRLEDTSAGVKWHRD
ncbi:MAG: cysteine--tRNA ligase [Oscillospiraceae bacterium]|nr:cysteine--tRNA ligase [Oscillospiraceae bacterium]